MLRNFANCEKANDDGGWMEYKKSQVLLKAEGKMEQVGWLMVFNTTFNNNLVISWRSVLLMGGNGVPGENHRPVASH